MDKLIGHSLKGQSHEIFVPGFFHQTAHSGPIRDVLGPFLILANFHRVIGVLKRLFGA